MLIATRSLALSLGHIDMPARAKRVAQTDDTDGSELPCFNGSQLDGARWLRELDDAYHLFDADISYHLSTATSITNSGKTTVIDAHHAALLKSNLIKVQQFGIFNPPPMTTGFKNLYNKVRSDLSNKSTDPIYANVDPNDFPTDPPAIADPYLLAPDRAQQIDLKLRNELLSLITSSGRRRHYRNLTQSGCELLQIIKNDSKATAHSYSQDPNNVRLKAELSVIMKKTLSHTSQVEFDDIRDAIEGINDQLPDEDKVTSHQLCDHYLKLIRDLGNVTVISALDTELKMSQAKYGDAQATVDCIVRTLTNQLVVAECKALEANGNYQGNSGRALAARDGTGDPGDNGSPNGGKSDPKKSTIHKSGNISAQNKPPPDYQCNLCGRNHFENRCFKNPNADDSTKKWAARVAPTSPAAKSWKAQQNKSNGSNGPPAKDQAKDSNKPPHSKTAKARGTSVDIQDEEEPAAALTAQAAQTAANFSKEALQAALDNEEPTSFVIGRANVARARSPDPVEECTDILSAVTQHWCDQCVDEPAQASAQIDDTDQYECPEPLFAAPVARAAANEVPAVLTDLTDQSSSSSRPKACEPSHFHDKNCADPPPNMPWRAASPRDMLIYLLIACLTSALTVSAPYMLKTAAEFAVWAAGESFPELWTQFHTRVPSLATKMATGFADLVSTVAAQLPFIAVLDAACVAAYSLAALLTGVFRHLCQAVGQAIKPNSLNNTFMRQLKRLSTELIHLRWSWRRIPRFIFFILHLLLLITVLCPLSRLANVEDNTGESLQERIRLEWQGPAPNMRSYLPLASTTVALCLAATSDCLTPSLNYEPITTSCTKSILVSMAIGVHPISGTLNSMIHCANFISNNQTERATATPTARITDLHNQSVEHDLPLGAGRLLLSAKKGKLTASAIKHSTFLNMIIDSGASYHIHHNLDDLTNVRPCRNRLFGVDHQEHICTMMGDLELTATDSNGTYHDVMITGVRYAPKFKDTLLSVAQLWKQHSVDSVFRDRCHLHTLCGKSFPFKLNPESKLYEWQAQISSTRSPVKESNGRLRKMVPPPAKLCSAENISKLAQARQSPPCPSTPTRSPEPLRRNAEKVLAFRAIHSNKSTSHLAALNPEEAARHMHRRLHLGATTLNKLSKLTADAPENLSRAKGHDCHDCVAANAHKHPHKESRYEESYPGRLIHADIAGPFKPSAVGHFQYLLVLVDDHSRFKFAFPLINRSDAPGVIQSFVANFNHYANNPDVTARSIGTLLTDGAGEFTSHKFRDELSNELINKVESPPEVHALNGVAERAIKSIFAQVRSNLSASKAPITFWPYAVAHAVDVLNRTTTPPHGRCTAYESLTGDKPRIMGIMPWGCRAFAIRHSAQRSKTNLDPNCHTGMNLGRSESQPGAYSIWVPSEHKVVTTSEVYFDDTYMPWRAKGDERVGEPVPLPVDGDAAQPPTLPKIHLDKTDAPPERHGSLSAEFDRVNRAKASNPTIPKAHSARLSKRVLVLFSGPYNRPDGLIAFLQRFGLSVFPIDNNERNGGNKNHDLLNDQFFERLLRSVQRGEFLAIYAAPPCSTFSISRFKRSSSSPDGGPPIVRRRHHDQIMGAKDCPEAHQRELRTANTLINRTCILLRAAVDVGTEFAIENPADHGDPTRTDLFVHAEHAPLWIMPDILQLSTHASCRTATFPMCQFGAKYKKDTTLMFTPGLARDLSDLNAIKCTHLNGHEERAGGERINGVWNSAATAAYPADFNLYIAQCINRLVVHQLELRQHPSISREDENIDTSSAFTRFPPAKSVSFNDVPLSSKTANPSDMLPASAAPSAPPTLSSPLKRETPKAVPLHAERSAPTPLGFDMDSSTPSPNRQPRSAPRPEGPISSRLRSRAPAMFAKAALSHLDPDECSAGSFLVVQSGDSTDMTTLNSMPDPKNHFEAMKDDKEGWTSAEEKEMANHRNNGSFEIIDRSKFESEAPGRRLVKMVWVYKRKRNGTLKARLCVQGCSQQPGVDFDQTHCATMRGTSLRMLSSIAGQVGLKMRRWDFVSAFLQGELEKGEVVYCSSPPGPYNLTGSDGRERVYKVKKPIYGMAQAGRRWQRTLFPWLKEWGLEVCASDSCVFKLHRTVDTPNGPRDDVLLVGCYVDDLFILYNHDDEYSLYHKFTKDLQARWSVDDEGEVSDLLNVEISHEADGVLLRQTSYIEKLTSEWMPNGVPANIQSNSTPHSNDLPSLVNDALVCTDPIDPHLLRKYQSLVGSLLYAATNTRPDIAYPVGMLCRAMGKPTEDLLNAALRVLGYLYRHRHIGLKYSVGASRLSGMSDADWAVRHSTSGFVFSMGKAAISWGSKKQNSVALSSCEAEIMAASEAAKEAVYLDRLLDELGFKLDSQPIQLALDNKAAIDSSYNPENHSRTKHIERRHYFIRELVEANRIVVPFVRSEDNHADFFTKPLVASKFFPLRDKIMNVYQQSKT